MQIIGQRIPRKYFITKGTGESEFTHHAGSYHLALAEAKIETQNIMLYSSILPKEAIEIERPKELIFGAVMECIMSTQHGIKGETLSVGIAYANLFNNDQKIGSIVVERNGNYSENKLIEELSNSIKELKDRSFEKYTMDKLNFITETFIPKENYGTALVAICFTDYIIPTLEN